ncbi:Fe-S protein [Microbacterium sp. X-17]|uniref:Fe-S protein n=1 Tax=Microbacterium sp. X-17 TaxID=3144404 RepID=UPI0031F5D6AB
MEILRGIVVLIHLVGFAILFGSWVVEVVSRRRSLTRLMAWGLTIAGAAGLILAAPWGLTEPLNYIKLGTKLLILVVIGAVLGIGLARQRRTGKVPPVLFWLVGILTLTNATIALLWN